MRSDKLGMRQRRWGWCTQDLSIGRSSDAQHPRSDCCTGQLQLRFSLQRDKTRYYGEAILVERVKASVISFARQSLVLYWRSAWRATQRQFEVDTLLYSATLMRSHEVNARLLPQCRHELLFGQTQQTISCLKSDACILSKRLRASIDGAHGHA